MTAGSGTVDVVEVEVDGAVVVEVDVEVLVDVESTTEVVVAEVVAIEVGESTMVASVDEVSDSDEQANSN